MRQPLLAVLLTLLLATTACTGSGSDPDARPAAEALARALEEGSGAPWDPETSARADQRYDEVVTGMGDVTPSVRVTKVSQQEAAEGEPATATATLEWTWPMAEQEWSYATTAELTLQGDEWVAQWGPGLVEPSLQEGEVLEATTIAARRGDITGAGDTPLVTYRPVTRFGIDRILLRDAPVAESARAMARLVGIDPAPYVKRVKAAGDRAFVEAIVFRRDEIPARVAADYGLVPGARAIEDELPLAPTADFAEPILGRVGEVTAEMIEDDPDRYQVGDVAGLSGLQARYEDQLAGTPGVVVDAVATDEEDGADAADDMEDKERELFRFDPVPGTPLRLTLDQRLQRSAEQILADVAPASALVAVRPSTGAVLAAANGPGNGGANLATYGQAAPGSTFKTVSALALLRAGLTPRSPVPCTDAIVVDGKRFTNYDDYPASGLGRIPLSTALANSCNTAFISQADRPGRDGLADAAASLGLGIDHDLGFPAYFGQVEPAAPGTARAAAMIGQGTVLASPLVMATVLASVVSGHTVVPTLVTDVDVAVPDGVAELTAAEAGALRSMLGGVVTSGSGSLLADVPGPPVIAKTGTAEFDQDGRRLTHAWMIAAQGDLAVAVYVDVGESGSGTAGPLLERFLRAAR